MGGFKKFLQSQISNVYVHSLRLGSSENEDSFNSFFWNVNEQVDFACKLLKNDTKLAGGFHAIGFSQGSQFLRAYVQRCNDPPVKNLISIGGQHRGVYGWPHCDGSSWTICRYLRRLIDIGVYWPFVQNRLVQAEYWQSPLHHES